MSPVRRRLHFKFFIVLKARGAHELSEAMRLIYPGTCAWSFGILFFLWVASVTPPRRRSLAVAVTSQLSDNCIALTNHSMPKRASVTRPASAPQALGYKCITCNGEFDTRHGAACHRRHPSSNGTACADPNSIQSVSITPRPDVSAGILRLHYSAPLGTPISFLNCTHPSEPTSSDL
jgi:hypothetical protein